MENVFKAKIIKKFVDIEEAIELEIAGIRIVAFTMSPNRFIVNEGESYLVELTLNEYCNMEIKVARHSIKEVLQLDGFLYRLTGLYDADKHTIDVGFMIDLNEWDMFDYGYLHNQYIQMEIGRFDVDILQKLYTSFVCSVFGIWSLSRHVDGCSPCDGCCCAIVIT